MISLTILGAGRRYCELSSLSSIFRMVEASVSSITEKSLSVNPSVCLAYFTSFGVIFVIRQLVANLNCN